MPFERDDDVPSPSDTNDEGLRSRRAATASGHGQYYPSYREMADMEREFAERIARIENRLGDRLGKIEQELVEIRVGNRAITKVGWTILIAILGAIVAAAANVLRTSGLSG